MPKVSVLHAIEIFCTCAFIATLFTIDKAWNKPNKWIKKMCYTSTKHFIRLKKGMKL